MSATATPAIPRRDPVTGPGPSAPQTDHLAAGDAVAEPPPDIALSGTPCATEIERLQQHIARLTQELDQARAEIADLRLQNSLIIETVTNPHLKAEAPTIIRTAVRYVGAKARGEADQDGYVNINPSVIGDDFPDAGTPIRSRATVKRHLDRLADDGLIQRKVTLAIVQKIVRDAEGKPIRDETGKPKTAPVKVEQTVGQLHGRIDRRGPQAVRLLPSARSRPWGGADPPQTRRRPAKRDVPARQDAVSRMLLDPAHRLLR